MYPGRDHDVTRASFIRCLKRALFKVFNIPRICKIMLLKITYPRKPQDSSSSHSHLQILCINPQVLENDVEQVRPPYWISSAETGHSENFIAHWFVGYSSVSGFLTEVLNSLIWRIVSYCLSK